MEITIKEIIILQITPILGIDLAPLSQQVKAIRETIMATWITIMGTTCKIRTRVMGKFKLLFYNFKLNSLIIVEWTTTTMYGAKATICPLVWNRPHWASITLIIISIKIDLVMVIIMVDKTIISGATTINGVVKTTLTTVVLWDKMYLQPSLSI